jgi:hypothetical protein
VEEVYKFQTIEQARNAAIKWLQDRSVSFGPHRKIEIGRLGVLKGKEVGTSANKEPYWRIRLDYDPAKGAHFNAESGKGPKREKAAFCFHGSQPLIAAIAKKRTTR